MCTLRSTNMSLLCAGRQPVNSHFRRSKHVDLVAKSYRCGRYRGQSLGHAAGTCACTEGMGVG